MTSSEDRKPGEESVAPSAEVVVDERVTARPDHARILVTNDDGIESPGIRHLAIALARQFEVLVVAPSEDMSGSGTALGRFDPRVGVELIEIELDGVDAAFEVDGPPGLAVLAAGLGAFGRRPDLVVSGVNAGMNTGHSVIHSGTVGAALTARSLGSHGLAVSLEGTSPDGWHWETAVEIARSAARWIVEQTGPRIVMNLNVPSASLPEVRGIRWADLDDFGHLRVAVADTAAARLQFEVRGSASGLDPACDTALCLDGYATLTLLSPVEPKPFPSLDPRLIWDPSAPRP